MPFKQKLFLIPLFFLSSCRQPQIPEVKHVPAYYMEYYSSEFVKLIDHRFALIFGLDSQYYIEVFLHGYFQVSSNTTGPVWDAAVLGDSIFIQFMDTTAIGYYNLMVDTFKLNYLTDNPGYTGLYKRDNNSIYGVRNDSVFIYYPNSLQEELFTALPFSTRHIIVSPDGRYVGTPEGKIYDTREKRVIADFRNLGWDFSFYDDTTLIFGDTCGGYAIKWLRITDRRVIRGVPVTDLYVNKPVKCRDRIYFIASMPDNRHLRNYQYQVNGFLMIYFDN